MDINMKQIQKLTASVIVLAVLFGLDAFTAKLYQPIAQASPNDALETTAEVNGTVYAVEVTATKIYIGGDFTQVGGQARNNVAALNLDGTLDTSWNPNITTLEIARTVSSIYATDTAIYVGGNFDTVNGATARNNAAAFEIANGVNTGTALAWNPNADSTVYKIIGNGTKIYLGGLFTTMGGVERYFLAAVDSTTGALDAAWNPKMSYYVYDMLIHGTKLYAVGLFGFANQGQGTEATRNFGANFNLADGSDVGAVQSWNPNLDNVVNAIAYYNDKMYLGGVFNQVGAELINYAARVNTTDGAVDASWTPEPDGVVYDITISDEGNIFLGGAFDNIGAVDHKWVGLVNSFDGLPSTWDPVLRVAVSDTVYALDISDSTLEVGGDFGRVNGSSTHANFAQFRFPKISFTLSTSSEGEDAGTVSIEASLDIASDMDISFDISNAGSTATKSVFRNPGDYDFVEVSPYTITAGNLTKNVDIEIVDDSDIEDDETVVLTMLSYDNPIFFGTNAVHILTIVDNDAFEGGVLITPITIAATEGGVTATYEISLTVPALFGETVTVTIVPDAQVSVSPTSVDFTNIDGLLAQEITVTAVDDATVEGAHVGTITHTVSGDSENYNAIIPDSVTVNITDNDTAPVVDAPISNIFRGGGGTPSTNSGSGIVINELPHPLGTIININSTLYVIIKTAFNELVRRPYTSAMAFLSYGFNSFDKVVLANQADINLKVGEFVPPQDGRVICSNSGSDYGTCYLITQSKKAGFVSKSVFTDLGFSFKNALYGDISFLQTTPNIEAASQAHLPGTIIVNENTIQLVSNSGLLGFTSPETFVSWGYDTNMLVSANSFDTSLIQNSVVPPRQAGELLISY
jgi:hypothetical protein